MPTVMTRMVRTLTRVHEQITQPVAIKSNAVVLLSAAHTSGKVVRNFTLQQLNCAQNAPLHCVA